MRSPSTIISSQAACTSACLTWDTKSASCGALSCIIFVLRWLLRDLASSCHQPVDIIPPASIAHVLCLLQHSRYSKRISPCMTIRVKHACHMTTDDRDDQEEDACHHRV